MTGIAYHSGMRRGVSLLVVIVLASTALVDFTARPRVCGSHACCIRSGCSMMQGAARFAQCDSDRQAAKHDALAILAVNVRTAVLLINAGEGAGAPLNLLAGVTQEIERPPNI
jgi:hypothetical protein